MTTPHRQREERFRSLYADAYEDVLRFVQRRVHAAHAEDVVAEAFLVAWRRFEDAPRLPGDRRAWLFGIARGACSTRGGVTDAVKRWPCGSRKRCPRTARPTASIPSSSHSGSTSLPRGAS
jgi:Sigma-70 region 2